MNLMLEQLLGLLDREAALYQSVLDLIEREKEAAVRSELNALNETVAEKESLMARLRKIDEQRSGLTTRLAEILGYSPKELTLKKLSQLVDEPFAGRLQKAGTNLKSVLNQVQEANQRSRQIFEHSLDLLHGAFNLLNELLSANTVYHRTGNIHSSRATGKCVSSDI